MNIQQAVEVYPGQFELPADRLQIAVSRNEILTEMRVRGEDRALDDLCYAVAVVVDALEVARSPLA